VARAVHAGARVRNRPAGPTHARRRVPNAGGGGRRREPRSGAPGDGGRSGHCAAEWIVVRAHPKRVVETRTGPLLTLSLEPRRSQRSRRTAAALGTSPQRSGFLVHGLGKPVRADDTHQAHYHFRRQRTHIRSPRPL
jgi:hypothetical protein